MCGIFGICSLCGRGRADDGLLKRMSRSLNHRGPDGESVLYAPHMEMGVRRLKAMSHYDGYEPVHNEDASVWAVLDGEIFNHEELRAMLRTRGHRFYTTTSEELVPHLYEEFGYGCALPLNGVFAFAIWDQDKRRLLLVRDRVGVKPLHYAIDNGKKQLAFGSEIKAILQENGMERRVNVRGLRDYLSYAFVPAPETMFEGIMKLPPGHYLVFDDDGWRLEEYWDVQFRSTFRGDYSSRLYDLLKESVRRRLPDSGPAGVFLSGGFDSTIVTGLATQLLEAGRLKTFSVGSQEHSYSELDDARYVAEYFGTEHHEILIRPDTFGLVQKLVYHTDEPLADWSIFPTYLASRLAKSHVDTVLSGDAADDLFAGHERLKADRLDAYYRRLPSYFRDGVWRFIQMIPDSPQLGGTFNRAKGFLRGSSLPVELRDCRWGGWAHFSPNEQKQLLQKGILDRLGSEEPFRLAIESVRNSNAPDVLSKELHVSLRHLSQGIIVARERISMANSLNVRMPYLDYDFLDFAMAIPSSLKIRSWTSKWILKKSMSEFGVLPKRLLRKGKMGFTIPMKIWFRGHLRDELEHLMSESLHSEYFNHGYVRGLVEEHLSRSRDNSPKLWALMLFFVWHSMYIDGDLRELDRFSFPSS